MFRSELLLGIALLATGWVQGSVAQRLTTDTLSFQDLPGIFVVVEPLDSVVEAHGLHADSLRLLLETKFSRAGMRLLDEDQWQTTLGNPMAFLDINVTPVTQRTYLYRVQLELRQLIVLSRDSTIPAFAPTWKSGQTLGVIQATRLGELRSRVVAAADRFIDAYVAGNRRRRRFR